MINDPIHTAWQEKRQTWRLQQGNETFYDDNRVMLEWETEEEALAWAAANLPRPAHPAPIKPSQTRENTLDDLPLFRKEI